jgi:UDP:flavonoid glycosyltransferase YjiC (YdhE family)
VTVSRRILFAAAGGHGHLQPLLPLAQHAAQAGHDVLVTGAASLAAHATSRGLAFTATGPHLKPIHAPLVVHGLDEERRGVAAYFVAKLGRARAEAVLDLCRSWRPHVIVRDEVDFGAAVAAEAAGLPHVPVIVIGAGQFILRELVSEPLELLLSDFEVRDVAGVDLLHRHLTLTPFPRSFRSPEDLLPGKVVGYHVAAPPRAARREKSVFVTLGTIFNTESGDLLRTAALGAAECPNVERVIVATGEHVEPANLGRLPRQVVVHQFVEQDAVLAGCAAVISHAGSGTVLGALKQALPMVSLPMGADQQLNAARLDALGLGVSLRADSVDVGQIRDALGDVLAATPMQTKLEAVRDEICALHDPAEAIRAVEELVP